MIPEKPIVITGEKPGPTLAIFAGVHGNETAGVFALQDLLPKITIPKGKLYLVFANPPAIKANVRMLEKNLNRCFSGDNTGTSYEDNRARELMVVLDECDALLDLHMFYDDDGQPFAICEDDSIELASKFDVDIISTNWSEVEPGGTDSYMYHQGKVGICIECGPISKAAQYKDFAINTIYQFLEYYGMADRIVEYSVSPKRIIRAKQAVFKTSKDFVLSQNLGNFDRLSEGQVVAVDETTKYTSKAGECIIFPHYNARVGEEAYIIGEELPDINP